MRKNTPPKVRRAGRVQVRCGLCQEIFETVQSQVDRGNGKYCSREHWLAARLTPQEGRTCTACEIYKPAAEFGINPQHPPRLRSHCANCRREKMREKRGRNPAEATAYRLRTLLAQRGMTPEDYAARLAAQGGVCLICSSNRPGHGQKRLVVDHDHATGRVRGLLCNDCNVGLGRFKDDPSRLASAIKYLARPSDS